jgi:crotonobetainyl-CoA:carnitine CoA-transferase CaiB-like acyl-CoA transferase
VLELTTTLAGPFCGRLLADFGAEVIKVEPATGDHLREMGKRVKGKSLYAASVLRNKSLIALDLRTEAGQDIAGKLAEKCDIVIENFRPGTLEKWNLGYDVLSAKNPRLVMVRISGFGQSGPYSRRPGYGIIAEALSGLRHLTGEPDAPPPRIAVSLTDYIAAVYAAFGAVTALHHAQRTGRGQVVDTALFEGAFSFTEPYIPAFDKLGIVQNRTGHRLPNSTPNNLYFTRDGQFIIIAAPAQPLFQRLAAAMGQPELATDDRFRNAVERSAHEDDLDAIISQWTERHTLEELEKVLHEADIPASRAFNIADIFADPHYEARGMLPEVPDEDLGPVRMAGVVPKFSATPGRIRWAGRQVGQDTRQVLLELAALSPSEVDRLEADGVVMCANGGRPQQQEGGGE